MPNTEIIQNSKYIHLTQIYSATTKQQNLNSNRVLEFLSSGSHLSSFTIAQTSMIKQLLATLKAHSQVSVVVSPTTYSTKLNSSTLIKFVSNKNVLICAVRFSCFLLELIVRLNLLVCWRDYMENFLFLMIRGLLVVYGLLEIL